MTSSTHAYLSRVTSSSFVGIELPNSNAESSSGSGSAAAPPPSPSLLLSKSKPARIEASPLGGPVVLKEKYAGGAGSGGDMKQLSPRLLPANKLTADTATALPISPRLTPQTQQLDVKSRAAKQASEVQSGGATAATVQSNDKTKSSVGAPDKKTQVPNSEPQVPGAPIGAATQSHHKTKAPLSQFFLPGRYDDDPRNDEEIDTSKFGLMIQALVMVGDSKGNRKLDSMFDSIRPPAISAEAYWERIRKHSEASNTALVLALIYLNRIAINNPLFRLDSYNVHRLLVTAVLTAAKFFDDRYMNNAFYAKVAGVPGKEMNVLEVDFLILLNFHLYVEPELFRTFYAEASDAIDKLEGKSQNPSVKMGL